MNVEMQPQHKRRNLEAVLNLLTSVSGKPHVVECGDKVLVAVSGPASPELRDKIRTMEGVNAIIQ